jgi:hypothetical protein
MANRRIFYAIQQVQIAPNGTGAASYTANHVVYGLQSVGINTQFNLEQIFEIGQLSIYENIEDVPDVEVTLEKVLDGRPLIYHLSTPGATSATLVGRSNIKCQLLLSIFDDSLTSASGTPITECEASGMFVSSLNYNFQVDGPATESVTLVGNNKLWRTAASGTGRFPNNNDTPTGSGGVQRREDFLLGSGNSVFPPQIEGVSGINSASGYILDVAGSGYNTHLQSVRVSTNLGRDQLRELGRKAPYFRFVQFPVQVQTDIEVLSSRGDLINALEDVDNLTAGAIVIKMREGTIIDLGVQNKIDSVSYGGGNAGAQGGNVTTTYSFITFNDMTVKHPADPAGLAYP